MSPRVAVAVLSLTAVPVAGETGRPREAAPVLRLVWFDPSDIAAGSELMAREEATSLLNRMGATASWQRSTSGGLARSDEVWVILVGTGPQQDSGPLVLGATRKRHSVARVVWIRLPNIRAALGIAQGPPLHGLPSFDRRLLSVALGRVIAHEVVHAVVPSLPHGTGLMSGSLSRRQLTAAVIPVEGEVALAFRAALLGDPVFAPSEAGVLTAEAQLQEKDR